MGMFTKLAYSAGQWTRGRPTAVPFLLVDVHDSKIATVDYRAADATGGRFFLGYEPRIYFEEPDASDPVDGRAESEGFCRWLLEAEGLVAEPEAVQRLLAAPDGAPPEDETVEQTVERLLDLAGLPAPEWPADEDAPAG